MRLILFFGILLLFLLPLASALDYDSIINQSEPISLEYNSIYFGDLYIVSPSETYFGESFDFIVGIEIKSDLSSEISNKILLDVDVLLNNLPEENFPTISVNNSDSGNSFIIFEWNINLWTPSNPFLSIDVLGEEIFRENFSFDLEEKIPIKTEVLDSQIINLIDENLNVSTEARIALAEINFKYSTLEFNQMQMLALEEYSATKTVEKVQKTYSDNSSKIKTVITISLDGDKASTVDVIEIISKDLVSDAKMIKSIPEAFVVKEDPVIMWHVTGEKASLSYEIKGDVEATGNTILISSMTSKQENKSFPWRTLLPLLVIPLIAGFIVFFARFEPKTRK